MSFGFSVGDFLAVGQLSWKVYKKCKDSPGSYAELSNEVGALHNVMKETEELFSQQDLTPQQENRLLACQQGCGDVLKDLDRLLVKYESLGTNSRRTFDRMGFGTHDTNDIRLRLISNASMLDAFNNASSHKRLENKLNLLIAEVRAGKREGSVISTQTFDTTARNDQETWEALRRELEDIGISPGIVTEKRQFIIAWFQEAVAAGRLEEDVASDDNENAVSLHELEELAGVSDNDSIPRREISSMGFEPSTTQRRAAPQSAPSASRHFRQPGDISSSPPQKKGNSRIRVTYLLQKLLGKDGQFLQAAKDGNVSTVKKLLDKGVDIQARGPWYHSAETALHLASSNGKETTVQFLLSQGADVHAKDKNNRTALHRVAMSGDKRIVDMLLEQGADIESKDTYGYTALIVAATIGHQDAVQLLLENGADIESKDTDGDTALIHAAAQGYQATVQLLLENGADIESKDTDGDTALIHAAAQGYQATVQLLLDKGADIESKTMDKHTALTQAAFNGHQDSVQLLLDKGADIESKTMDKHTALTQAAFNGHQDSVQLLLENGADIESKDTHGFTALIIAADRGHQATVQLLLDKGADIESETMDKHTALTKAVFNGHQATVQLLLKKRAQINTENTNGHTALQFADKSSHKKLAQILRNAGARR